MPFPFEAGAAKAATEIQTTVQAEIDDLKANKAESLSKEEVLKILKKINDQAVKILVKTEEGIYL